MTIRGWFHTLTVTSPAVTVESGAREVESTEDGCPWLQGWIEAARASRMYET
jgi:hypothetical protein